MCCFRYDHYISQNLHISNACIYNNPINNDYTIGALNSSETLKKTGHVEVPISEQFYRVINLPLHCVYPYSTA